MAQDAPKTTPRRPKPRPRRSDWLQEPPRPPPDIDVFSVLRPKVLRIRPKVSRIYMFITDLDSTSVAAAFTFYRFPNRPKVSRTRPKVLWIRDTKCCQSVPECYGSIPKF